ncbi:unnamed protein product [Bursaphelenchus xylophilus]|nr:unnamed protein product [Bursaphelenchus xylophilus]CAG9114823.1 unnamed protein product [Bursaphelenchus xylophilus]
MPSREFGLPSVRRLIQKKMGLSDQVEPLFVRKIEENGIMEDVNKDRWDSARFERADIVEVYFGLYAKYRPKKGNVGKLTMKEKKFKDRLDKIKEELPELWKHSNQSPTKTVDVRVPDGFWSPGRRPTREGLRSQAEETTNEAPERTMEVDEVENNEPETSRSQEQLRKYRELATPKRPVSLTPAQVEDQDKLMKFKLLDIIKKHRADRLLRDIEEKKIDARTYQDLATCLADHITRETTTLWTKNEIYDVIVGYLSDFDFLDINELLGPNNPRLPNRLRALKNKRMS